jgi:hypothetical protein
VYDYAQIGVHKTGHGTTIRRKILQTPVTQAKATYARALASERRGRHVIPSLFKSRGLAAPKPQVQSAPAIQAKMIHRFVSCLVPLCQKFDICADLPLVPGQAEADRAPESASCFKSHGLLEAP